MKIQKILVPIDFSPCSVNALEQAANLAHQIDAELYVLHGYHIPLPAAEMTMNLNASLIDDFKRESETKFSDLESSIESLNKVQHSFHIEIAFAVDAIVTGIKNSEADMICMGTTGASGFPKSWLGSITSSVIDKSWIPVLSIPNNTTDLSFKKIVFASDYRDLNLGDDLKKLVDLAGFFNSEVHILNINPTTQMASSNEADEAFGLDHVFKNIKHSFEFSHEKNVEKGILTYLEEHEINLLAMMPRKHNFFEKLFTTSHTQKIASHCKIPLYTFHG